MFTIRQRTRAIPRGALRARKVGSAVMIAAKYLGPWQPHYERAPKDANVVPEDRTKTSPAAGRS